MVKGHHKILPYALTMKASQFNLIMSQFCTAAQLLHHVQNNNIANPLELRLSFTNPSIYMFVTRT